MKSLPANTVVPALVAVLGAVSMALWARVEPPHTIARRVPGMDKAPVPQPPPEAKLPEPGEPFAGDGQPAQIAGAWPWFRGPQRDAISHEDVPLARRWPQRGPTRLWDVRLGEGYAAAAVAGGCVYVLDHVHDETVDLLRGLSQDQRMALVEALAPDDVERVEQIDPLLRELFPAAEGPATASAALAVTAEELEALKSLLQTVLSSDRQKLVEALQRDWLDQIDRSADVLRCLSLDDGREIWRNGYRVPVPLHHGRSRTIPAVIGRHIVTLGPKCDVVGWDAETGEALWTIDLVLEHGATVPPWYAGQCPLVDEVTDQLVLAVGGEALLLAVDYRTGQILWESPNPRGWEMTHSSIIPVDMAGRRTYVYCGKGGVAGVAADDGSILWDTSDWKIGMATCPSPVPLGDGRIFFSGGYNAGALMLRVERRGGRFAAETLYRLESKQFGSEQQTPVCFGGHLYGVRQRDKRLICLDAEGDERWDSGKYKFGAAPYMIADGLIYALNDEGKLTMAEATPEAYRVFDQAVVLPDGVDSWGPMALVDGRLIVRDLTRMVCLDVAARRQGEGLTTGDSRVAR